MMFVVSTPSPVLMGCPVDGGWRGISDSDVSRIIFTEQRLHYNVVSFKLFRVERKSTSTLSQFWCSCLCWQERGLRQVTLSATYQPSLVSSSSVCDESFTTVEHLCAWYWKLLTHLRGSLQWMLEDMKTQGDRGGAPATPTVDLRHRHAKHAPSAADLRDTDTPNMPHPQLTWAIAHVLSMSRDCSVSRTFLRKKYVINILSLETVFVSKILNPVYFVRCLCRKGRVSILLSSCV